MRSLISNLFIVMLTLTLMIMGCDNSDPITIVPGESIGGLTLGMTFEEVKETLGKGPFFKITFNRLGSANFWGGITTVFSSSLEKKISEDAVLISMGCTKGNFEGPIKPGMSKEEVINTLGQPDIVSEPYVYYFEGISFKYKNDKVAAIGIFKEQISRPYPPEMEMAK